MSQAQLLPTDHFSPSVTLYYGRPATTSREVASFFGKRHDDVLKSIRNLRANCPEEFHARNFAEMSETVKIGNGASRQDVVFILYRDGFMLLVMGYTGKKALAIKLAYIEAFNRLEAELAAQRGAALPEVPHIKITPSTTASRKPLEKLVKVWARQSGLIVGDCWTMLNAAFNLQSITELPEEWIPDALEWVQGKIDSLTPALPPTDKESLAVATSTALAFRADFPDDMGSDRKEAMQRIERIARDMHTSFTVVRNIVRLGCHPGSKTMRMSLDEREAYETLHNLYTAADESLCAAYNALDAGYKLGRLYGRG